MMYNKDTNYNEGNLGYKVFGCSNTSNIKLDASKPETLNWTEISIPEILSIPSPKPNIEHINQVHVTAEITNARLVETPYCLKSMVFNLANLNNNGIPSTLPNGNYDVCETDVVFYLPPLEAMPNEEGTCLTGRKLLIEGNLIQKIIYTADVDNQSVHSIDYKIPFSTFIITYVKVQGDPKQYIVIDPNNPNCHFSIYAYKSEDLVVDLCEEFGIDVYIEDISITQIDCRTLFKNSTLFLRAKPCHSINN